MQYDNHEKGHAMYTELIMAAGDLAPTASILADGGQTIQAKAPDVGGLGDWVSENVVPLVITAVGVVALVAGAQGNTSKVATIFGCVVIALGILAMALSGPREALIDWVSTFFS